ncbi:hypothetical protein N3942_34035, partial [Bacillus thuringiensis]|nr:hypothetical protein [Bacillus thuringiensis]
KEGINATCTRTVEQTENYMEAMNKDTRFDGIVFKIDEADGHAIKKMHVRPRTELVTHRLEEDINPHEITGKYLEPKDYYDAMKQEDTVIIDARNDYE